MKVFFNWMDVYCSSVSRMLIESHLYTCFSQGLYRQGKGLYAKVMSKQPVQRGDVNASPTMEDSVWFLLDELNCVGLWQHKIVHHLPLLYSYSLNVCLVLFKNALKRCLRFQHTKMMRCLILINLIFYSGQGGVVTSSSLEISSCDSCLQLVYKNIKQGHL